MPFTTFAIGDTYTRDEVQRQVGLEPQRGGNWYTGYHREGDEWFIFCGVGTAGRTGHDYGNEWNGRRLHWSGKTDSHASQNAIQSMTAPGARVHIFTRTHDRERFTYHGLGRPAHIDTNAVPVRIVWEVMDPVEARLPQEPPAGNYAEGAIRQITVNAYERNAAARAACLAHHGTTCAACGVVLADVYGPVADGFIHVHHLKPLASVGNGYTVDPVADLRPVCPNCHAIIHLHDPPMTPDEVRALIDKHRGS